MKIRVGTRQSALALKQTDLVIEHLRKNYENNPNTTQPLDIEVIYIETKGDKDQSRPLAELGGQGLFVKEIEKALIDNRIDLGVHSLKDMPAQCAHGLVLTQTLKRESPFDYLILKNHQSLEDAPQHLRIGTGSFRRRVELEKYLTSLGKTVSFMDHRGNIDTRLNKLEAIDSPLDGIVLAQAGIHRLDLRSKYPNLTFLSLPVEAMIPAPGQGLLGLEVRGRDSELINLLNHDTDLISTLQLALERSYLAGTKGSCHIPIGGYLDVQKLNDPDNGSFIYHLTFHGLLGKTGVVRREKLDLGKLSLQTIEDISVEKLKKNVYELGEKMAQLGFVALVGAGPGDETLITLKGLNFIRQADVIAYDYLSGDGLLNDAKPSAELIYVGKKAKNHTMSQEEINNLLIEKAQQGAFVVRLKGGDPFVFGRGGEEALALEAAGISYEIVPGITSAIGGLAAAGIPITHRGISASFHVVTGHGSKVGDEIPYQALTQAGGTIVILMGIGQSKVIAAGFIEAQKPKNTPVAIIYHATTQQQSTLITDLEGLSDAIEEDETRSGLIVIGEVAQFHQQLMNYEQKPLFGQRVLVTLPESTNKPWFISELKSKGADVFELPLLDYQPFTIDRKYLSAPWLTAQGILIWSSPYGVSQFFKQLSEAGLDSRSLYGPTLVAIGKKTAKAMETYGVKADICPDNYDMRSLITYIKAHCSQELIKKGITLYRSLLGDKSILDAFSDKAQVVDVPLYTVVPKEIDKKTLSWLDEITKDTTMSLVFTSRSGVEAFENASLLSHEKSLIFKAQVRVFSIGPMTTTALQAAGFINIIEAQTHTYEGIITTMMEVLRK